MGRIILALVVAAIVDFVLVMLAEAAIWLAFPVPEGLPPAELMARVPSAALVLLVLAWALAALAGCLAAVRIAPGRRWIAWAAAVWPLLGAIDNFIEIPHPVWVIVIGSASPFAAAWLAWREVPQSAR